MATEKIKIPLRRRIFRYSVNTFLYLFIFITLLLLFTFIISQTNAFKNWLKDQIVEIVNAEINGKVSIGKIGGTIFTSLELDDVTLTTTNNDTVASFTSLLVKTSPLKLLFKDIYVRKIELKNVYFNLVEESDGELNLLKIFPTSDEPDDTTSSEFPFTITVAELDIINLNFNFQNFENRGSTKNYKSLYLDDFRIADLNLSLSAFANISKTDVRLNISRFDFKPNLDFFELENFSGNFLLTQNAAMIDNLNIKSQNTNLNLSAAISGVDFIKNFSAEDLGKADLRLDLNIENFNFNNLTTFVEATDFLHGNVSGVVQASGNLNNLNVDKLNLILGQTNLIGNAKIENLISENDITINATLDNSVVTITDVNSLLKDFGIPVYDLGQIKFNQLRYNGKPNEFVADISIETPRGKLSVNSSFNFRVDDAKYDVSLTTNNLDLSPFIKFKTNLNSDIKIVGEGFNPSNMKANFSLVSEDSRFESFAINSMKLNSEMFDKILSFNLDIVSDSAKAKFDGKVDFIKSDDPFFELKTEIEKINLAEILSDSSLNSRINMNLDTEGRGFDIDSMNLFIVMDIEDSYFSNFNIDSTRFILDVRRNDNGKKILNLISNVADFTMSGNYKLSSLIKTIGSDVNLVVNQLKKKFSESLDLETENLHSDLNQTETLTNQIFEAKLLLDFKDFVPIKIDEKNSFEIGGEIRGNLLSEENFVLLNLNSDINYLKFLTDNDLFFITKSNIDLSLKQFTSLEQKFSTQFYSDLNSERIYFGKNIYNFATSLSFDSDSINFSAKGFFEDFLSFNFTSYNQIFKDKISSNIDNLVLNFKGIPITNNEEIKLSYSKGDLEINQFKLNLAEGLFSSKGIFGRTTDGLVEFSVRDLNGNTVLDRLLNLPASSKINSQVKISGKVTGNFNNPRLELNSDIDNVIINDNLLGSIKSDISYSDQNVKVDFKLIEQIADKIIERLTIVGNIPLKNSVEAEDSLKISKEIELKIIADDLNLSPLGKILPQMEIKYGYLESEVYISGTINKPYVVGYVNLNDIVVRPSFNNLDYYINSSVYWDDEIINIEKASITNEANLRYGGTIQSDGYIKLKELSLDSISIKAKGKLKLLDQISKEVNQFVYGDLAVETKSDIIFSLTKDEINLNLPISITKADLVLPLSRSAYSNTSDIIYRFASSIEKSDVESELDRLIEEYESRRKTFSSSNSSRLLNYNIDVGISNEAKVVVVLSKELNQDLIALLSGNISIISRDGIERTSGQFNLLEGSKLSFIKTFEARGNVRFEKLDNPLLDITATYRDYIYPVTESGTSQEQEVAVKIKLKGPLSDLNQNFVRDPNNIGVYIGTENIQKEQRDESKTPTDALFFVIAGKFTDGATLQERSTVASTATSFAGSIIGNVLNQYLGDYVRSVQLRQFGDQTKFSLIGKVGNFRYEIGGTTEVFQDLSRANVKIELPIQQRLILRLERKESITDQSTINAALYNEFGIKYKFEF